jgi:nitrogen fixation/metabolism regulation signal transduction histidine kinase
MDRWLELFAQAGFRRSGDTAHDLKTPLNVAVLNLELLRMRVQRLAGADQDAKLAEYARSIELELRRMARIFDSFFILSSPPKGEGEPIVLDLGAIAVEAAGAAGYAVEVAGPLRGRAHESRIRQAFKLFFEGASNALEPEGRGAGVSYDDASMHVHVSGTPAGPDFEITKVFKFYYTDRLGNPDLSLAAARLIAETYGGELNGAQESDKVTLRLSLPLSE